MPEKRKVAPVQPQKETLVYLGPEILGVVLPGAVYSNGLPAKLEETEAELPALKMLLVSVKDVVKTKKELKREASAVSICYQKAAEYAAQKGAK